MKYLWLGLALLCSRSLNGNDGGTIYHKEWCRLHERYSGWDYGTHWDAEETHSTENG